MWTVCEALWFWSKQVCVCLNFSLTSGNAWRPKRSNASARGGMTVQKRGWEWFPPPNKMHVFHSSDKFSFRFCCIVKAWTFSISCQKASQMCIAWKQGSERFVSVKRQLLCGTLAWAHYSRIYCTYYMCMYLFNMCAGICILYMNTLIISLLLLILSFVASISSWQNRSQAQTWKDQINSCPHRTQDSNGLAFPRGQTVRLLHSSK